MHPEIYNELYHSRNYNSPVSTDSAYKFQFIKTFLKIIPISYMIYDIGSGRGFNTKKILEAGYKVIAVDFADIIDTYESHPRLTTYKVDVIDFLGHVMYNKRSTVICTDFLEHVSHNDIDSVLYGLSNLSPYAFFGIANHSDCINQKELHLIQQGPQWWRETISVYYERAELFETKYKERFFFIMGINKNGQNS